jgi:hypothetical protein
MQMVYGLLLTLKEAAKNAKRPFKSYCIQLPRINSSVCTRTQARMD